MRAVRAKSLYGGRNKTQPRGEVINTALKDGLVALHWEAVRVNRRFVANKV